MYTKALTATPRDSLGNKIVGKQITWTSQNEAVATIDATGIVVAVAVGRATIRATVDNVQSDASVTVTPPATSYIDYKAHFPYRATSGRFVVASDIDRTFSHAHLEHLLKVWQLFSGIYARTPGEYTEVYYTRDLNGLYTRILQRCPTVVVVGGRNVTTCFNNVDGTYVWFVVPYVEPDFGTQLHEIGHSFLYFTQFESANWPWFNEGISMYWESGSFALAGELLVTNPLPYLRDNFRRVSNAGTLVPLATLQSLNRDQFYANADPARVYSQSGMLLYYLYKQYPAVMQGLIAGINARTLSNNSAVISYVLSQTGLTTGELESRYTQYALQF